MNNKGDLATIVIMIVVLFGIAVGSIIFSEIFLDITAEFKAVKGLPNRSITAIEVVESRTIPLLDFLVFFTFFAIAVGLIVASIYIDVHPALVILFILALILAVIFAGLFSNIYAEFTGSPTLTATASQFSLSNLILGEYFPLFILAVGTIVIIILYGKSRNVGEV